MPAHSSDYGTDSSIKYYPALTGIRAVAAFMVVLFHLNPLVYANQHSLLVRWTNYFIQQLHIGVPIFFVLSGFLITHRYINNVELSAKWLKLYLWNRFTRIYPVYFILTVVAFLVIQYSPESNAGAWQTPSFSWKDKAVTILLNLTLLKAFFKTILTSGIPTAWSLTVEESFYIMAPFLLVGLKRNLNYLLIYPALLLLLGGGMVFMASLSPYFLYGFMQSVNFMLRFTFFGRCVEFMCGVGLALYILRNQPGLSASARFTVVGAGGTIFCTIVLAIIKVNYTPTALWPTSEWSILVQNFILPIFVALLFYGLITERSSFKRVLETDAAIILGKSFYALYLLHIGPLDNLFSYYVSENPLLRIFVYSLLAILIFKFIEEPIRLKLRSRQKLIPVKAV